VLGRTKLPPVDVIETGIGIIFAMVVAPGVGVGDGVDVVTVGVGVFVLGARVLLAEACTALAAKIIKTSAKTRIVRNIFFFCIEVPLFFKTDG
jgi:hypothetical protein